MNTAGETIGTHTGIHRYTIGQRRGLGIAHEKPLYVVQIERAKNQIIVGEEDELESIEFIAKGVNWVAFDEPSEPVRAEVKVRYRHDPSPATIHPLARRACSHSLRRTAARDHARPGDDLLQWR